MEKKLSFDKTSRGKESSSKQGDRGVRESRVIRALKQSAKLSQVFTILSLERGFTVGQILVKKVTITLEK